MTNHVQSSCCCWAASPSGTATSMLLTSFAVHFVLTVHQAAALPAGPYPHGPHANGPTDRLALRSGERPQPGLRDDRLALAGAVPPFRTRLVSAVSEEVRSKHSRAPPPGLTDAVIVRNVLGMVPAMQPELVIQERTEQRSEIQPPPPPATTTTTTRSPSTAGAGTTMELLSENYNGRRPDGPDRRRAASADAESCRLAVLPVIVRRGGCKKQVMASVCRGSCNTQAKASRRWPFVSYRTTTCRPMTSEELVVDMNDDECLRQRIARGKRRLSGYDDVSFLVATSCFCAICS